MRLILFVIGMLASAIVAIFATLLFGGSITLALAMGATTLVVAQCLYVVLLIVTAWLSEPKKQADWAESGRQSRTKA